MASSDVKLEQLAAKAAQNAVKNVSGAYADLPDFAGVSLSDKEALDFSPPEDGDEAAAFDIFDYCDTLSKKNHQVQYVVKRNGEMVTVKYHPYSWEQLQKEFKGGLYQITAKSLTTKRYLKSESRTLSDPPKGSLQDEDYEIARFAPPPPPPPQGPNFMEIFTLMNTVSDKQRQEARELAKEQAQQSQTTMMAFVEMMRASSQQSQAMVLEIAKMTQAISEKMADSQRQMVEKMETRFEKVVEKLAHQDDGKKQKGVDMFEVMKLQQESYDRGFALANQTNQIAELKAQEKLELLEEIREARGSGEPAKEESITDTLIKTMLPAVSQAMLAQTGQMRPPAAPQPRRQLQTGPARPRQPQRVLSPSGNQQSKPPQAQGEAKKAEPARKTNAVATQVNLDALKQQTEPPKSEIAALPVYDEVFEAKATEVRDIKWYDDALAATIGQCLLDSKSTREGAEAILGKLAELGVTPKVFTDEVKHDDMMGIVKNYNLPEEANPWFEEVYAHIKTEAGVDAR